MQFSCRHLVALLCCLSFAGCARGLQADYGQRRGGSVNGTAVLAEMFLRQGHTVSTWPWLSPRLTREADCIVWCPNNFKPPSEKVCAWCEDWLQERPGRTLIYVGRDYDAACAYWRLVRQGTSGEEYAEFSRQLAGAQGDFRELRKDLKENDECGWFSIEPDRSRAIRTLRGEPRWVEGLDAEDAQVEIAARLVPPVDAEVLLASENDVLVSRRQHGASQLIVVANGSFLLNLPLVNHEDRKLAGQLIDEIGAPPKRVFFLESPGPDPAIYLDEPKAASPSAFRFLGIWPLGLVLAHLAILGTIFMAARYPIFGVPRGESETHSSDFGRHIVALGDLLNQTQDVQYARDRLKHYQAGARPDARVGGHQHSTKARERIDNHA